MNSVKNKIRLIIGIITALLGIVFLFIPFLPFGYLLLFISAFFLARYIPILKKFMSFLRKRDKKGYIQKAEEKMQQFEDWIDSKLTGEKKEPQKE